MWMIRVVMNGVSSRSTWYGRALLFVVIWFRVNTENREGTVRNAHYAHLWVDHRRRVLAGNCTLKC